VFLWRDPLRVGFFRLATRLGILFRLGWTIQEPLIDACKLLLRRFTPPTIRNPEDLPSCSLKNGLPLKVLDLQLSMLVDPQQIFFESERGGRFAVFDWQTVSAGSGGNDLARIIVQGLNIAQREASDRRLIELYHSLLLKHGVKEYSYQDCYDDFRSGLLISLVVDVIAAANVNPAWIEAQLGAAAVSGFEAEDQLGAAIDAHNVQEVLPA